MSNLYRTRVCAIGSEEDIRVLLIRMLENFGVYEEPENIARPTNKYDE